MMKKAFDTMKEVFDDMDAGMRKTFDDMVSALTPRAGRSRGRRADASAHPAAFSPPPEKLDEFHRPRPIEIPEDDRAR